MDFFTGLFQYSFLQNALFAALLSSVACGITGSFVVMKRIGYIAGGIAHAVMGGVGIAYFLGYNPLFGAILFSLLTALVITIVKIRFHQKEDTVVSALWSVGMALGILFVYLKPGYNKDILSFLFGNLLMVPAENLVMLVILDIIILLVVFIFYRQFIFISFDEEYSVIRGIPFNLVYLALLSLIALTVVILMSVVGLILVIALLTLPPSIAMLLTHNHQRVIIYSIMLSVFFTVLGLFLSHVFNLAPGALIIVISGVFYLLALGLKQLIKIGKNGALSS